MLKSMTGYGEARGNYNGKVFTIQIRSVNNRFLDLSVKLPRALLFAETPIKSFVQSRVSRGKVDVFVSVESSANEDVEVSVNEDLVSKYITELSSISDKFEIPNDISVMSVSRLPEVIAVSIAETDNDKLLAQLNEVLVEALLGFDSMRKTEGAALSADIISRIETMESLLSAISEAAPTTELAYRARLENKMREVLAESGIDESRILTEAAIFADRIAVDEETVRLKSHFSQLRAMAESEEPIGRKMDFLVQELNREANTIGSKCQNSEIAHTVVDLKAEIEKIREQVQNVE